MAARAEGPGSATLVRRMAVESGRGVPRAANPGRPGMAATRANETMMRAVAVFVGRHRVNPLRESCAGAAALVGDTAPAAAKRLAMAGSEVPAIDGPAVQGCSQGAADGAVVVVRSDRRGTRQYLCDKGTVPREIWNRLGTKVLPKLTTGSGLSIGVEFSVNIRAGLAPSLEADLKQVLSDLGLQDQVKVERS